MSTRGRPPVYPALLAAVPDDTLWHPIRSGFKNITPPSGLRRRYPGWDFQMTPTLDAIFEPDGTFTLLARRLNGDN